MPVYTERIPHRRRRDFKQENSGSIERYRENYEINILIMRMFQERRIQTKNTYTQNQKETIEVTSGHNEKSYRGGGGLKGILSQEGIEMQRITYPKFWCKWFTERGLGESKNTCLHKSDKSIYYNLQSHNRPHLEDTREI